jgi:hypothetical protein
MQRKMGWVNWVTVTSILIILRFNCCVCLSSNFSSYDNESVNYCAFYIACMLRFCFLLPPTPPPTPRPPLPGGAQTPRTLHTARIKLRAVWRVAGWHPARGTSGYVRVSMFCCFLLFEVLPSRVWTLFVVSESTLIPNNPEGLQQNRRRWNCFPTINLAVIDRWIIDAPIVDCLLH